MIGLLKSQNIDVVFDIISIEAADPKYDPEQTVEFLQSVGATHVEILEQ